MLTLDDEMQYRCAGYIQAEIERFAELLEGDADRDEMSSQRGSDDEQMSGEEDREENDKRSRVTEKKKKKGGHKKEGTVASFPSIFLISGRSEFLTCLFL